VSSPGAVFYFVQVGLDFLMIFHATACNSLQSRCNFFLKTGAIFSAEVKLYHRLFLWRS